MVNKYKRKTQNASWDEAIMSRAMEEAAKGTVSGAAKKFGINLSTLQRHIKKGCPKKKLGRFTTVFTDFQETELLEYVFYMDNLFYGLTKLDFLKLVYQYAEINHFPHPFKGEAAGEDWFLGFKSRHPDLTLRQPEPTSIARVRGFNKPQVQRFFDILYQIDKHKIDATRIYNVDETGIQTNSNKPPKILSKSGKKQVGIISSVERGKLTTVVCCCNAAGSFIPPFLIFGRKRMVPRLLDGAPPGTVASCTDNGWINGPTFLEWLRHFVDMTRPSPEKKILLLMDNHESHKHLAVLDFASKNNVIFVSLPPHTTHRLQPLHTCVYGPFKKYFEQAISLFQRTHVGRIVSQYDVSRLFGEAYRKAASTHNAIKGFASTGVWPTNRNIFDDSDYMPSMMTDRPEPTTENENVSVTSDADAPVVNTNAPDNNADAHVADVPDIRRSSVDSDRTLSPSVLSLIEETLQRPSVENIPNFFEELEPAAQLNELIMRSGVVTPTPMAKILEEFSTPQKTAVTTPLDKTDTPETSQQYDSVKDLIHAEKQHKTPFDIRPIPLMEINKSTRKRKPQKAEILTSTPIKEQQREKENKKKPKKTIEKEKAKSKRVKGYPKNEKESKKKSSKVVPSTSGNIRKPMKIKRGPKKGDDSQYPCLVCSELYTHPPIEDWIRCDDCNMWAHEACTSYAGRGSYYCDACQE